MRAGAVVEAGGQVASHSPRFCERGRAGAAGRGKAVIMSGGVFVLKRAMRAAVLIQHTPALVLQKIFERNFFRTTGSHRESSPFDTRSNPARLPEFWRKI